MSVLVEIDNVRKVRQRSGDTTLVAELARD